MLRNEYYWLNIHWEIWDFQLVLQFLQEFIKTSGLVSEHSLFDLNIGDFIQWNQVVDEYVF